MNTDREKRQPGFPVPVTTRRGALAQQSQRDRGELPLTDSGATVTTHRRRELLESIERLDRTMANIGSTSGGDGGSYRTSSSSARGVASVIRRIVVCILFATAILLPLVSFFLWSYIGDYETLFLSREEELKEALIIGGGLSVIVLMVLLFIKQIFKQIFRAIVAGPRVAMQIGFWAWRTALAIPFSAGGVITLMVVAAIVIILVAVGAVFLLDTFLEFTAYREWVGPVLDWINKFFLGDSS